MRFHTTILQSGKTAAGIEVPEEIVTALGSGKRAAANVMGGDELDVDIELDTAPREVTVPDDFAAALAVAPAARTTFESLSYSNKSWHVLQIEAAKTDETRQRRISKSVEALGAGRIR